MAKKKAQQMENPKAFRKQKHIQDKTPKTLKGQNNQKTPKTSDTSYISDTIKKEPPYLIRKRQAQQKKIILESIKGGSTVVNACLAAGIARETFYEWMKDNVRNKDFIEAIDNAQDARVKMVEDGLYANAVLGQNVTAQIFYLCNRASNRWKNVSKIEHGGNVQVNSFENVPMEELLKKLSEIEALIKKTIK